MTHPLRRHDIALDAIDITVRLRDGDDYITRNHEFIDDVRSRVGLVAMLTTWRRLYVTRRHLGLLDARGLADIGLDTDARDREVAKPFWKI